MIFWSMVGIAQIFWNFFYRKETFIIYVKCSGPSTQPQTRLNVLKFLNDHKIKFNLHINKSVWITQPFSPHVHFQNSYICWLLLNFLVRIWSGTFSPIEFIFKKTPVTVLYALFRKKIYNMPSLNFWKIFKVDFSTKPQN